MTGRAKHAGARAIRALLVRWVRSGTPSGPERVIVVLSTAFGMGGTIRTVLNLAGELAARHDVEIVSVGRTRKRPFFGEFPPGVRVSWLEDRTRAHSPGPLERLLARLPSTLMHRRDRSWKGWSLWADVQLVRRLRGARGVLITTRPGLNFVAAQLAPPGLVLIGQEHMHFNQHKPAIQAAMREHYPALDVLVVLTAGDRRSYEQHLGGGVRVERIPNSVRPLGTGRADLDARTVLSAGRLGPQKGYDMLIEAFASVARRKPGWRLRIFGKGPSAGRLEELIAAHGLTGTVRLEQPDRDLGAQMEQASIYALSSRFEGLPLVLLEAMSKGMAVVAFDCPTGPADVIEHRRNGLLVPPERPDLLADAIVEMIADRELRAACAAAAVETASAYSIAAVGAQWEELLAGLREAPAGSAR